MYFPTPALLAAAVAAISLNAQAAQNSSDSETNDPLNVVVTGTRSAQPVGSTPGQVDVITRAQIEASGAQSVIEALRASGAVQIGQNTTGNSNDGVVSMRGFGENAGQNVLILVDGRPLNNPTLEAPNLATISLNKVERIEVLHGSAGVLYGQHAVGGVINIITRDIEGTHTQLNGSAGSYNHDRLTGTFEHRYDSGLGLALSADRDRNGGYRDNSDNDYDQAQVELSYRYSTGEILVSHERINNNQRLPGSLSAAQTRDDRRQSLNPEDYFNDDIRVDRLYLQHRLTDNLSITADWSQRDSNGEGSLSGFAFPQDTRVTALAPRLTGHWDTARGAMQLIVGSDLTDSDYQAWSSTDIRQDTDAVYARVQLPIEQHWSLTLGARHSKVEDRDLSADLKHHDSLLVKELGINWTPTETQRVFIRRDENFRFATADENGLTLPGVDFLDPQTGVSWELGWSWSGSSSRLDLTLYQLDLDSEILFDGEIANPDSWTGKGANINLDSSRRRGLVLSAEQQLTSALRVGGTYTLTDSELTAGSFKGNEVPYVARHQFSLYGNYRLDPQWSLYTDLQYTGSRYLAGDDANAQPRLESDLVVNTSLSWRAAHWSAQLNINNLFDERYYAYAGYADWSGNYYYPAAERNLLLTVGYTF